MIDKFAASFLINSALYIVGVFVAGLVWGNHLASLLAIVTAALALVSSDCVLTPHTSFAAPWFAFASWIVGLMAFGALIVP